MAWLSGLMSAIGWGRTSSMADGGFRAARNGRLSAAMEQDRRHLNSAIMAGGEQLRARSRFHTRENSLLIGGKETWSAFAIGTGLAPNVLDVKPTAKRALQKWFNAWAKKCDFDGRTTFFGLQALVDQEVFEAGEAFIRLVRSEARPLRLQLITSEQLPYNVAVTPESGNEIRLGIEFNPAGERVAYHFFKAHPGDTTRMTADGSTTQRIPASEILHVYRVEQPGQLRGIPRTRGALLPAHKLADYDDATLERAGVGSKFAVAITKDSSDRETMAGAENHGDGSATFDIEAGTVFELEPGEKIETVDPPDPGDNYDKFRYAQQTRGCAAMGTPYAETTGDVKAANFSSIRTGRQPFKRKVNQHQQFWIVPQFCDPVWEAALADALLRGDVALPRGAARTVATYSNVDWVPDAWEYVSPKEEAEAQVILADNLLKPRSKIVAEQGGDPEETDELIAADQAREDKLKLRRGAKAAPTKAAGAKPAGPEGGDPAAPDQDQSETGAVE